MGRDEKIEAIFADIDNDVRGILSRREKILPEPNTPQWAALASAALVDSFDPRDLVEATGSTNPEADAKALIDLSAPVVAPDDAGEHWALRANERKQVLGELVRDQAVDRALQVVPTAFLEALNPVVVDQLQGKSIDVDRLPWDQLADAARAVELLHDVKGVPASLDDAVAIEGRLQREYLVETLKDLARDRFAGREVELQALRDYVWNPSAPEGAIAGEAGKPLVFYGPGGMGKSTLLAEFLLRDVIAEPEPRCPFAYLDFDRRSLSIVYPVTILAEALVQLGAFYPQHRAALLKIRDHWRLRMRGDRSSSFSYDLESEAFSAGRNTGSFTYEFCAALAGISVLGRPFVLILDTFEEIQSRSSEYVEELFRFLEDLRVQLFAATAGACRLRVILSGRVPVPDSVATARELKKLDSTDAQLFLEKLGVHPSLTPRVAKQVPGVPLTLRLAAELVLKSQDKMLAQGQLDGLHEAWYRLGDEGLQGLIFQRYLQQIHDRDVRKLAHPGLVLRRITVPVIEQVLAEPCGLKLAQASESSGTGEGQKEGPPQRTAEELYLALAREISLVSRESNGVLKHRPELRVVMLELINGDPKMTRRVRKIHNNAVAYYARFNDAESRAEEIYHRLQLQHSGKKIRERWIEGLDNLKESIDELPPRSRPILKVLLDRQAGLNISEAELSEWDQATWERYAERRAERLVKLNRPKDALAVLSERTERLPGSRLFPLEVSIHKHLEAWAQMRETALRGIASCADAGNPKLAYELVQQLIVSIILPGDLDGADRAIAQARQLARLGDPLRTLAFELELDLAELRVALAREAASQSRSPAPAELDVSVRESLNGLVERIAGRFNALLSRARRGTYRELARKVAGAIGAFRPEVVRTVMRRFGVVEAELNEPRRRLLCRACITWDEITSANRRRPDGVLVQATGTSPSREPIGASWTALLKIQGVRVNDVLESLMDRFGLPDNALRRFVELYRMPHETEMFAPLHTRLLDSMSLESLGRFVHDELGEDLQQIAKGTDGRDVVRQLLSWAYENGRFQELMDRVAEWVKQPTPQ